MTSGGSGAIKAVAELTNKSYEAMTSNGEVQLSFHMYKLSFLNFLVLQKYNLKLLLFLVFQK